jgi:hypothetical protein
MLSPLIILEIKIKYYRWLLGVNFFIFWFTLAYLFSKANLTLCSELDLMSFIACCSFSTPLKSASLNYLDKKLDGNVCSKSKFQNILTFKGSILSIKLYKLN